MNSVLDRVCERLRERHVEAVVIGATALACMGCRARRLTSTCSSWIMRSWRRGSGTGCRALTSRSGVATPTTHLPASFVADARAIAPSTSWWAGTPGCATWSSGRPGPLRLAADGRGRRPRAPQALCRRLPGPQRHRAVTRRAWRATRPAGTGNGCADCQPRWHACGPASRRRRRPSGQVRPSPQAGFPRHGRGHGSNIPGRFGLRRRGDAPRQGNQHERTSSMPAPCRMRRVALGAVAAVLFACGHAAAQQVSIGPSALLEEIRQQLAPDRRTTVFDVRMVEGGVVAGVTPGGQPPASTTGLALVGGSIPPPSRRSCSPCSPRSRDTRSSTRSRRCRIPISATGSTAWSAPA